MKVKKYELGVLVLFPTIILDIIDKEIGFVWLKWSIDLKFKNIDYDKRTST
jgi:hypothetical protein